MRTPSRRLKVVVIGAGIACIEFLYKAYNVYHLCEYVDFTVFEANEDVGGTWLVNRYPGVAWYDYSCLKRLKKKKIRTLC